MMTNEEAIKTLRELWRETNDTWYEEVYNMAIEALQGMDEVMSVYGGADMSMGVKSLDSDDLVDGNEVKVLGAEGGEEE